MTDANATAGRFFDADSATGALLGISTQGESSQMSVANETRARLVVQNGSEALVLAPLETQLLDVVRYERLSLKPLEDLGYVRSDSVVLGESRLHRSALLVGAFYGGLAFLLWGVFVGTSWLYWALLGLAVAAAAVARLRDEDLGVKVVQGIYIVVVLVVGVGMPVLAIWAGGDIQDVWNTALDGTGLAQERATLTLLGRGIQTVFLVLVTLLPGLLFFLFDRYRLKTLAAEFTHQIFRLDRSVRTRSDLHAKYGHLLTELYGYDPSRRNLSRGSFSRRKSQTARTTESRERPGTRLPVVLATIVFALGWIVVLLNAEVEVVFLSDGLRSLITPWQSATAFAFLGAYVFVLQAALRAYLRGDLRPKFYSYAALRVIVAVVFAWVLDVLIDSDGAALLVPAFVVGLVPDTFLHRLRQYMRTRGAGPLNLLTEKRPLTQLEGIDVYDGTRLEQEGVTNVEGLAYSNLIELMLQTRIPATRLLDWADQALLYLHIDTGDKQDGPPEALTTLRGRGIRTASDLLVAHKAAQTRGDADVFLGILGSGPTQGGPPVLQTIVDTIKDDEWVPQIMDWRNPAKRAERTLRYPDDFKNGIPIP
jgi:hypothetical protein